jgi:hypothetical protein
MATSPNYGWLEPDNTDLVKNGALAIRTLGNAIDTTMATMTPKSLVDAKGDLIAATADNTPARLAVGNNGETLVADSSTSTGLRYTANFAAGKNAIINGDFGIWQRGTSFTPASFTYTADRWVVGYDGAGATRTVSQQTFTPATAPVAGYEGTYFLRYAQSVAGTSGTYNQLIQRIEDVRKFAGNTVTISFWAKASSTTTLTDIGFEQYFGSGGSADVQVFDSQSKSVTTAWQRFTVTLNIPSISGKTIGTGSYLKFVFKLPLNSTFTLDFWGVQVEAGSVATAFQTATGTIQGELAACQRYYFRYAPGVQYAPVGNGMATSLTNGRVQIKYPTTMRVVPTSIDYSNLALGDGASAYAISALSYGYGGFDYATVDCTSSSLIAYRPYVIFLNTTAGYLGFGAEL